MSERMNNRQPYRRPAVQQASGRSPAAELARAHRQYQLLRESLEDWKQFRKEKGYTDHID